MSLRGRSRAARPSPWVDRTRPAATPALDGWPSPRPPRGSRATEPGVQPDSSAATCGLAFERVSGLPRNSCRCAGPGTSPSGPTRTRRAAAQCRLRGLRSGPAALRPCAETPGSAAPRRGQGPFFVFSRMDTQPSLRPWRQGGRHRTPPRHRIPPGATAGSVGERESGQSATTGRVAHFFIAMAPAHNPSTGAGLSPRHGCAHSRSCSHFLTDSASMFQNFPQTRRDQGGRHKYGTVDGKCSCGIAAALSDVSPHTL
ncbi:hypothetical protein QFZ75_005407 [Streptomyces sp. V3I8]|nr:hypothetical protein [Streptomyces sp. V3I8]